VYKLDCWHAELTARPASSCDKPPHFAAPWHDECVEHSAAVRKKGRASTTCLVLLARNHEWRVAIDREEFSTSPTKGVFTMLVLTRKYQEKIRIGDDITITVLRTKGKAVRLGIEAPAEVPVIRGELAFEPAARCASTGDGLAKASNQAVAAGPRCATSESTATWDAEPPHRPAQPRLAATDHVALKRVPRNKVAEVLPQIVANDRPLRAMMDRR
jgi:carbon storage regulator CsrA